MTFLTLLEANEACAPELDLWTDATETQGNAYDALEAAREAYDEAGGPLDDSTFWDVAGVLVVIGACLAPEPFSKSICAAGVFGGAATVGASEIGRQQEIATAEAAVHNAEIQYDMATTQAAFLGLKYFDCLFHHLAKGS